MQAFYQFTLETATHFVDRSSTSGPTCIDALLTRMSRWSNSSIVLSTICLQQQAAKLILAPMLGPALYVHQMRIQLRALDVLLLCEVPGEQDAPAQSQKRVEALHLAT